MHGQGQVNMKLDVTGLESFVSNQSIYVNYGLVQFLASRRLSSKGWKLVIAFRVSRSMTSKSAFF